MIEAFIKGSLNQRLIVMVISAMLIISGFFAAQKLSLDAFPDVTNIQVQVATVATGKSPEEVERFITVPIEIAMTGLPGLVEMRSLNKDALSLITLVFNDATDVYFARQLVMERLMQVQDVMPKGISPILGPVSTGLGEIFQYTLELPGEEGRQLTIPELTNRRTINDWVVRPLLRNITGVAEINSQGGYVKQYQVLVNPDRLAHYKIKMSRVFEALEKNNINSGAGVLPKGAQQYLIRGEGLIQTVNDIENIVLKETDGIPIYMRDIGEVKIGYEVRVGAVIKNGVSEAVGGVVMMLRGGNAKEVVKNIKERVQEINDNEMLPGGLKIVPYYDRSELVSAAISTVVKVLIEGIILVIAILFIFLGDFRSSMIVVMTLVLTPLITFMVMNYLGISANLMSLGGLAIAIGLMVDGSVVIVENTFHRLGHKKRNENKNNVIFAACKEVATPVLFGVGIIILVFLPLMTMQGMEGKMFSPLALTIAIALTISLILSFSLSPALCSFFLTGGSGEDTKLIQKIKTPYVNVLKKVLVNQKKVVAIAVGFFVASVITIPFLGTSFIPEMKEGSIVPGIDRVPNISIEESINMEFKAMKAIMEVPGVKSVVSALGRGESPADPQAQNESTPLVSLKPKEEWPEGWTQDDIANAIKEKLKFLPGVVLMMMQPISDRVDELVTGVRADVAVKIFGDDIKILRKKADEVAELAKGIDGATGIKVEKITGQQYLNIVLDRSAIARHGFNVSEINDLIEMAIGGKEATRIYEGQRNFGAAVRFPAHYRDDEDVIRNIMLTSPNGSRVSLGDLATIETRDGPARISREFAKRRVYTGINVEGRDLGGLVADLQQVIDQKLDLPDGYYIEYGGQFENMTRALGHLSIIIPLTIAGIFFLLFLLFNSVRFATLIITVLPFASIGGIFGLALTGEYLSVPASVGFITLAGIAVLNGVVLISCIQGLQKEGMKIDNAIIEGCKQRLRPVLMTASVAMLALIPFLFATGPGSEVQKPLAIVVIGGLITSTSLTLLVLPVLYKMFARNVAK
ncbi:cytochrome C peroxidase [Methylophilales bacterium MBRSG12]|uniref:Cytochrome C peroxidase n=1 Tax=Methylophilales bacterium MBRS-H7 TaxID=1623450 RepID=A0A0H4J1R4_9PROT|nr:cytochrome C peroxidase [Methylophilales bacterium MBRSF5]AKO65985.1 cytochrome C peroxidase [Methylophilales bacterium MBRS-H7]AKO67305.1 cytochrome C peroxidase [Methylophilales bacterium MBRSG12]